jgi:mannose-6-phosphate isomerase-like protein (cupin superfamily)
MGSNGGDMKILNWSKTDRPWGYFDLFVDNFEGKTTFKILHVMPGESLSLQYHFKRDQLYVILDDDFEVQYSQERAIVPGNYEEFLNNNLIVQQAKSGEVFLFRKNIIHRVKYTGERIYGRIIDIAFGENDESDIRRIIDNYGRQDR